MPPNTVGLMANCRRPPAVECAREIYGWLHARGHQVRLADDLARFLSATADAAPPDAVAAGDLLVALGGDGTILAANRRAAPHGTPVLGIHAGGPASFGFLTETTPPRAVAALEAVLAGQHRVEQRLMVAAEVVRGGSVVSHHIALNDLVLRAQLRMLKMHVAVGGTYIATYAADGIIVATPTGSTAYNLAAGGPLVHPAVEALLLTPICPHTLNVRSLLVGVADTIHVRLEQAEQEEPQLTVDGQVSVRLAPQDELRFHRAEVCARFVTLNGAGFYEKVQTRLRLGERFGG